jgi:hypothetical protein
MVWIGLISYPIYLWHWPLLSFAHVVEISEPSIEYRLVAIAATLVLSWLTYAIVESKIRQCTGSVPALALACAAALLLFGGLFTAGGALGPRHVGKDLELVVQAAEDWRPLREQFERVASETGSYYVKRGAEQSVLLLGDSHIEQYGPRIDKLLTDNPLGYKTALISTEGGCVPIPGVLEDRHPECAQWLENALAIANSDEVDSVVIGACWNCYFIDESTPRIESGDSARGDSFDYYYLDGDDRTFFRSNRGAELALGSLERLLEDLGERKQVFLLLDNPDGEQYHPKTFFEGTRLTSLRFRDSERVHRVSDRQRAVHSQLLAMAHRLGVEILDPLPYLCSEDTCPTTTDDGMPIYMDDNHLRGSYAATHATFIDRALAVSP